MRTLLPALFLALLCSALPGVAQHGKLGAFTNSGDVGNPAIKGSTEYDAAKGEYRMTGSGANMWAREDQFQYVWREVSGNMAISATLQFLGHGAPHRKAGIMLRKTLETDSPYADLVIHGNGMPAIQFRSTKNDITNTVDFPIDGPGTFKLKLVRQGSGITVFWGRNGAELKEIAKTEVQLGNPIYAGLAICSHDPAASDTVVFSDVSVEALASSPAKK